MRRQLTWLIAPAIMRREMETTRWWYYRPSTFTVNWKLWSPVTAWSALLDTLSTMQCAKAIAETTIGSPMHSPDQKKRTLVRFVFKTGVSQALFTVQFQRTLALETVTSSSLSDHWPSCKPTVNMQFLPTPCVLNSAYWHVSHLLHHF